MTPSYLG